MSLAVDASSTANLRRAHTWRLTVGVASWLVLSLILLAYASPAPRSSASPPWQHPLGLVLLALLAVVFLGMLARKRAVETYQHGRRLALLGILVCVTTLGLCFAVNLDAARMPNLAIFLLPASTLVIAVLLSGQLAFAAAVIEVIITGFALGGAPAILLPGIASCMAALVCAEHIWPPSRLAKASTMLGFANLVIAIVADLALRLPTGRILGDAGVAFAFGICAPLLALGAIFLLQRPFDVTSHVLLLELSNPKEPLLHRLQTEAPGTYYSSVIVANLAEAAAEAIGADPLLARVGALYHDIGKLRHPDLFSENQFLLGAQNVHTELSPTLSTFVILAHVRDGLSLARRYGLPPAIRDIIEEHHGSTMVSFFYHQARMKQNGTPLSEANYRYRGHRPRTKESAIIMMADALQAAAKSLPDPSLERLESLVQEIVSDRHQDGQLQDCELTFRELTRISQSFLRSLQGLHLHTRVEYPSAMRIVPEDADSNNELSNQEDQSGGPQTHRSSSFAG
jgi:cyclic-di-AMP phosphodiesterase PgpH